MSCQDCPKRPGHHLRPEICISLLTFKPAGAGCWFWVHLGLDHIWATFAVLNASFTLVGSTDTEGTWRPLLVVT
jgi:hypothetical protein